MKDRARAWRPQWYRMLSYFEEPARVITTVSDAEIILQGVLYEATCACPKCGHKIDLDKMRVQDGTLDLSPQLGICLIPPEAVGNSQGEALRRLLEANLRMPILLITNNVQLVRLKEISQASANRILETGGADHGAGGKVVAFPGGGRAQEPASRQGTGAPSGDRSSTDLGPATCEQSDLRGSGPAEGVPEQGDAIDGDKRDQAAAEAVECPPGGAGPGGA